MAWQIDALGGPVLAWEITRAARRRLWMLLPFAYGAWLVAQGLVLFLAYARTAPVPHPAFEYHVRHLLQLQFLNDYLAQLLQFQLLLVFALVPALTASSLGQEKERGTLFALFGTELTSREILVGKLLGRLMPVVRLLLTSLPVLVFVATWTGRGLTPVLLALAQQAVFAFALGAVCLLFGIWLRRAADAVIASYLFLGLAYFLGLATTSMPWAFWVDPFENLDALLERNSRWAFGYHLAVWAFVGAFCLRLGWGRLRKVCVEQRDRRPPRRLWAFRPTVGNDPIRWRECYVIGLAPMPILRLVPRWLALVAVFLFSATVACLIANGIAPGFIGALLNLDLIRASDVLWMRKNAIGDSVWYMGLLFILLADVLLIVRCGTSVAEEKRRNTWDDLLLTAQSFREITSGKMWGILQATVPYLVAFTVPVFLMAAVGGPRALFFASLWTVLPCTVVFVAALLGIDMLRVPRDMDETRQGGAFWFENPKARPRRSAAGR
jgi:ABC-type transport system involved in multi-copper enzyme maturation permease subunit